jgi:hypothetical protein
VVEVDFTLLHQVLVLLRVELEEAVRVELEQQVKTHRQ